MVSSLTTEALLGHKKRANSPVQSSFARLAHASINSEDSIVKVPFLLRGMKYQDIFLHVYVIIKAGSLSVISCTF